MTEKTAYHSKNLSKKLQKKEQRVLERLKEAQQAQTKALERYHRSEERLQKRMARVQLIEGRLTLVRQQIDDLQVNPENPSTEIEIPAWAQYTPSSSSNQEYLAKLWHRKTTSEKRVTQPPLPRKIFAQPRHVNSAKQENQC